MCAILLFKNMIQRNFDAKIKAIHTDRGGEFKLFMAQLQQKGILHKLTYPHTSKNNGVVECHHRNIVERCMDFLLVAHMPISY